MIFKTRHVRHFCTIKHVDEVILGVGTHIFFMIGVIGLYEAWLYGIGMGDNSTRDGPTLYHV